MRWYKTHPFYDCYIQSEGLQTRWEGPSKRGLLFQAVWNINYPIESSDQLPNWFFDVSVLQQFGLSSSLWYKTISNKWKCFGIAEASGFIITLYRWKLTVLMQRSLDLIHYEFYTPKSWYPCRGYHPSCSYGKKSLSLLSRYYLQSNFLLLKIDGKISKPIFSVVQLHHEWIHYNYSRNLTQMKII